MNYIEILGQRAVEAKNSVTGLSTKSKNEVLTKLSELLILEKEFILSENSKDIDKADENGVASHMIDRLRLTEERIKGMVEGIQQIIALKDPIGEVLGGSELANGLSMIKKRVPLGVIGIIFESRPNVTIDAAALCIKSGNVTILRGGSDAINSNKCLVGIIRKALAQTGIPEDMVILVEDTSREVATGLMQLNGFVDVLIPRGGKGLISAVMKNSTVPVIETGAGNCHAFVDETADLVKAVGIVDNSKTQRPSVCNAIETLLIHENIANEFLPRIIEKWQGKVKIIGDKATENIIKVDVMSNDEEYYTEYNDFVIAIKVVSCLNDAVSHINKYGTRHSEVIITENMENARLFQQNVDASTVYVNASTRFTDGFEMGLGAEIGISTQKLHARGPMGLEELTSYKYLINGNGEIRE